MKDQAIWALGNLAGESPLLRDYVIEQDAVQPICKFLLSCDPGSKHTKNASWALSNLCRKRPAPDYLKIKLTVPVLIKTLVENE